MDGGMTCNRSDEDATGLEMLSDSVLEQLESVLQMAEGISGLILENDSDAAETGEDGGEEDDEAEYAEAYGSTKEELREYVKKFREYARGIKKGVEEIYDGKAETGSKQKRADENGLGMKSPDERGHKMGCGCPGCSAYREFFGIKIETGESGKIFQSGLDTAPARSAKGKETQKYAETSTRPCGGKMYNLFHGERAELKNVFGKYTGTFDFGRAGY